MPDHRPPHLIWMSLVVGALGIALFAISNIAGQASCPDADGDGFSSHPTCSEWIDCDDHNPAVSPLAVETCNGIDDDCDGRTDELSCPISSEPRCGAQWQGLGTYDPNPNGPVPIEIVWNGSDYAFVRLDQNREIVLERFDARAQSRDTRTLQSAAVNAEPPTIAWAGSYYAVAWSEEKFPGRYGITYALLDASGNRLTGNRSLTDGFRPSHGPRIAGGNGEVGILWSQYDSDAQFPHSLVFTRLSDGEGVLQVPLLIEQRSDPYESTAKSWLLWDGTQYSLFWLSHEGDILFATVDRNGELAVAPRRVAQDVNTRLEIKPVWTGIHYLVFTNRLNGGHVRISPEGRVFGVVESIASLSPPAQFTRCFTYQWTGEYEINGVVPVVDGLIIFGTASYDWFECGGGHAIVVSEVDQRGTMRRAYGLFNWGCGLCSQDLNTTRPVLAWNGRGGGFVFKEACVTGVSFYARGCFDSETRDGADNNCNGLVDEGFDADGDGVDNSVDNCADASNLDQSDLDGDHRGDTCDCDPVNPAGWTTVGPVPQIEMASANGELLTWADQGRDVTYDAFMGMLSALRSLGDVASSGCEVTPIPSSFLYHGLPDPPLGDGQFFVVRSRNACRVSSYEHGAGLDSGVLAACP